MCSEKLNLKTIDWESRGVSVLSSYQFGLNFPFWTTEKDTVFDKVSQKNSIFLVESNLVRIGSCIAYAICMAKKDTSIVSLAAVLGKVAKKDESLHLENNLIRKPLSK